MQNIYDGLDEANSILERFCNRQVQHAAPAHGGDLYASAQSAQWLEGYHETAEADKQPVALSVFSGDHNSVHPQALSSAMRAIDIGLENFESEMRGGRGPGHDLATTKHRDTMMSSRLSSIRGPVNPVVSTEF